MERDQRKESAVRAIGVIDTVIERGEDYGHPALHFERTTAILGAVFGSTPVDELTAEDWAIVMICDKLARFASTRGHADSVRDIAGYAECWFMVRDAIAELDTTGPCTAGERSE